MSTASVDATLFRLVSTVVGRSETRFYLRYVCIDPHPTQGVYLVATDGHRMLVAHDPEGECSERVLCRPTKGLRRACDAHRFETRRVSIDSEADTATVTRQQVDTGTVKPVATFNGVVDAADVALFPKWQGVVPVIDPDDPAVSAAYNCGYVVDFAAIGQQMLDERRISTRGAGYLAITPRGGGPALIRWSGFDDIFGILMPAGDLPIAELPKWFERAKPEAKESLN